MVRPVGLWLLALLASANMAHGHVDTQLAVSAHEAAGVDSVTSKLAAAPIIPRWPRLGHLSAVVLHEGNDPTVLQPRDSRGNVLQPRDSTGGSNHYHNNNMESPWYYITIAAIATAGTLQTIHEFGKLDFLGRFLKGRCWLLVNFTLNFYFAFIWDTLVIWRSFFGIWLLANLIGLLAALHHNRTAACCRQRSQYTEVASNSQQISATVPPNVKAGENMKVAFAGAGGDFFVAVPEGACPGQQIVVMIPADQTKEGGLYDCIDCDCYSNGKWAHACSICLKSSLCIVITGFMIMGALVLQCVYGSSKCG